MADLRGTAFADLVYTVLVAEKNWTLEQIAEKLGMKYVRHPLCPGSQACAVQRR